MWRQLLVLGAIMLSGPPPQKGATDSAQHKVTPETNLAVLRFLRSLLAPRRAESSAEKTKAKEAPTKNSQAKQWEWDGESELPSLDDMDALDHSPLQSAQGQPPSRPLTGDAPERSPFLYPTQGHLSLASAPPVKSPLLHALTASLDTLSSAAVHSSTIPLRATALEVARIIAVGWIGAMDPSSHDDTLAAAAKAKADRFASLLPGLVSKAVRVLTIGDDGKRLSSTQVPGELVARAMALLRDVIVPVLNSEATFELRSRESGSERREGAGEGEGKVQSLEDLLAGLNTSGKADDEPETVQARASQSEASSTSDAQAHAQLTALKATLNNLTLAFRSLSAASSPRPEAKDEVQDLAAHTHSAAQLGIVVFAAGVLESCDQTLSWFSSASTAGATGSGDEDLSSILFRWILDLAPSPVPPGATFTTAEREAQARLDSLLSASPRGNCALRSLALEAGSALKSLPPAILAHRNALTSRLAHRVSAIAAAALRAPALAERLVSEPEMAQIWAERLVECLELDKQDGGGGVADDYAENCDQDGSETMGMPSLRHLEPAAARMLGEMLQSWGQVCASALLARLGASSARTQGNSAPSSSPDGPLHLLYWLLEYSRRQRNLARAQSARNAEACLAAFSSSTAALFMLRQLLCGVAKELNDDRLSLLTGKVGKRARKAAHKLAGDLIREVQEDWDEEAQGLVLTRARGHEDAGRDAVSARPQGDKQVQGPTDSLTSAGAASHSRGLPANPTSAALAERPDNFGPALNLSFVSAATVGSSSNDKVISSPAALRTRLSHQVQHLRTLQISLLHLSSQLLGPAFQPRLLSTIYPLVSALTHPSPLVAGEAGRTLRGIARATGYGDLLTLVRENVDYILGEASWRLVVGLGRELESELAAGPRDHDVDAAGFALTHYGGSFLSLTNPSRPLLSSRTPPLVLTEVMRLLGPSSLHLIEDSVDEILDALDRFHGFDDVADALLMVLDRLLELMGEEAARGSRGGTEESQNRQAKKAEMSVNPRKDLEALDDWLAKRRTMRQRRSSGVPRAEKTRTDVQEELESAFDKVEQDGDEDASNPTAPPTPATRSQQLLVAILAKSLPYLSHASALIRARVLRLFTAGTRLLAPPGGTDGGGKGNDKWQRREDLLLPLVSRAWPLILARLGWDPSRPLPPHLSSTSDTNHLSLARLEAQLSELEPMVHLAAIHLLEVTASCVPDFVGRRWVDEAWPRVRMILSLAEHRQREQGGERAREARTTRMTPTKGLVNAAADGTADMLAVERHRLFKPFVPHTPLYTLLVSTVSALTPLVSNLGPAMADKALWEMVTHPLIVSALDARQKAELRAKAVRLMRAAKGCDAAGSVWAALRVIETGVNAGREEGQGKTLDVRLAAAEIFAR